MKITHEMMQKDVKEVAEILKKQSVEIPSSWQCMRPGLLLMLGMVLWQAFVAFPSFFSTRKMDGISSQGSILFSAALGFIFFIAIYSSTSKYLSLPADIRKNSLIVNLIKTKIKYFFIVWVAINVSAGVMVRQFNLSPLPCSSALQFVSFMLMFFVFLADTSRYDLSLFHSVLDAWREGRNLDVDELKNEVADKIKNKANIMNR